MTWKLYYDGYCNLCHRSKRKIVKWANREGQTIDVDTLQSREARQKGYLAEMVLEADDCVYRAADAWLRVMWLAPWYLRWVAWLGLTKPTRWLATKLYGLVAKYRIKWFGSRKARKSS